MFDYLTENDKYHWDFVQIELNYLDWNYANEINDRNTDARYLYGELQKRGIPPVIMEPHLGGRLANVPQFVLPSASSATPNGAWRRGPSAMLALPRACSPCFLA